MAKTPITLTDAERDMVAAALEQAISSAKRGQNTAKQPEFKELYQKQEGLLQTLRAKIIA